MNERERRGEAGFFIIVPLTILLVTVIGGGAMYQIISNHQPCSGAYNDLGNDPSSDRNWDAAQNCNQQFARDFKTLVDAGNKIGPSGPVPMNPSGALSEEAGNYLVTNVVMPTADAITERESDPAPRPPVVVQQGPPAQPTAQPQVATQPQRTAEPPPPGFCHGFDGSWITGAGLLTVSGAVGTMQGANGTVTYRGTYQGSVWSGNWSAPAIQGDIDLGAFGINSPATVSQPIGGTFSFTLSDDNESFSGTVAGSSKTSQLGGRCRSS